MLFISVLDDHFSDCCTWCHEKRSFQRIPTSFFSFLHPSLLSSHRPCFLSTFLPSFSLSFLPSFFWATIHRIYIFLIHLLNPTIKINDSRLIIVFVIMLRLHGMAFVGKRVSLAGHLPKGVAAVAGWYLHQIDKRTSRDRRLYFHRLQRCLLDRLPAY